MDPIIIAILVMLFLMSSVILLSLHVLKEGHVMVIERFGVFYKIIHQPGIHFLIPMFERAIEVVNVQVQTRQLIFSTLETNTDEEVQINYTFQITDAKNFVYTSINSLKTFENFFKTTWIKEKNLDSETLDQISEIADSMGIHLIEVSIQ
jgi:regulator of protease activity HflC (stomatin/prohibitin superfamily)